MTKGSGFAPKFEITPRIAKDLMRIEAVKQAVDMLRITTRMLAYLHETARLVSTHHSTVIEGNRLTQAQVEQVITEGEHIAGRERDQDEVRGYYAAVDEMEKMAEHGGPVEEATIQHLHALVMGSGRTHVTASAYRDGQDVIRDSRTQAIVYMPPESGDVPKLMQEMVAWLEQEEALPAPIKAAIAHYQFATIHPYYDGNGRTARLLTTLILHKGGYDLKGLYALEEHYARGLQDYYEALNIGPSHNYYMGRAEAEITKWVEYFVEGMAVTLERVEAQARMEADRESKDQAASLRRLNGVQRKVLKLFEGTSELTTKEMALQLQMKPRVVSLLCLRWVEDGFLEFANASKKLRRYRLSAEYESLLSGV